MPAEGRYTDRPFTVVVCAACSSGPVVDAMPKLRAAVRHCPHAVLVTTECLLGRFGCVTPHRDRGVLLLLQPCTTDRVPSAAAHWLGPLRTDAEVERVCAWIAAGDWDASTVPAALRADVNLARASRLN